MGNKKRKIFVSRDKFNEVLQIKEKTLTALCEEAGLSYNTIRQCINKESIMEDDLWTLCRVLDVSFYYVTDNEGREKRHISQMDQDFINEGNYITDSKGYIIRDFIDGTFREFKIIGKDRFKEWFSQSGLCTYSFRKRGIQIDDIENQFPTYFDYIIARVEAFISQYNEDLLKDRGTVSKFSEDD